jgi:centriolar protein POC1
VVLKGHTGAVRSVDFSYDGRHLLTGSDDKTVKVWSLPNRKFMASLVGHSNWVRSAHFNSDASIAVSGGDDKTVKLWDVDVHQTIHTFYDHTDAVNSVFFHKDGNCVVSGSNDKTIKMWDIRSHLLIQHYQAHEAPVSSISLHESGYYLLSASRDSTMRIWDLREGRVLYTMQSHIGPVNSAVFSPDGHFFASGGSDELVMVWKSNLYGVKAPEIDWGMGERPKSAPTITNGAGQQLNNNRTVTHRPVTPTRPSSSSAALRHSMEKKSPADVEMRSSLRESQNTLMKRRNAKLNEQSPVRLRRQPQSDGLTSHENTPGGKKSPSPAPPLREQLPHTLTKTLDHIVGQVSLKCLCFFFC